VRYVVPIVEHVELYERVVIDSCTAFFDGFFYSLLKLLPGNEGGPNSNSTVRIVNPLRGDKVVPENRKVGDACD